MTDQPVFDVFPGITTPPCGHPDGCDQPATNQYQRPATDDEAGAHWDALEQHIRASGNPDYGQRRDDTVEIAEYRCDHPDHADPTYLSALAAATTAADAYTTAMHELTTAVGTFTPKQIRQLAQAIASIGGAPTAA